MKIRHYRDVPVTEPLPRLKKRVVIGPEEEAPNFIMRVIEVEPGCENPEHSHPWEHEMFVLGGQGKARNHEGKETSIGEGTTLFIPGGENHCLINTGSDVLRFICVIPTGTE